MDLNGDGKVTADELIQSTWTIFVQLVVVFGAIGLAILALIYAPLIIKIAVSAIALAALCAFSLGIYRMLRYERMESRDNEAWAFEKRKAEWEFDQARGVSEDARSSSLAQADIDVAALQILQRYYDGKEWTRDALVGVGLMTAATWNEANALLKKRGIRRGKNSYLEPESFADAWAIYCEKKLRANQYRIANGDWTEAV